MTTARIKALQWVHDVEHLGIHPSNLDQRGPTNAMHSLMIQDHQLKYHRNRWRLTEKGRRDLHEATG